MTSTTIRTALAGTLILGVLASTAAFAPSAFARGGGGVRSHGTCSTGSEWKLKAKNDDGALEVESEVDSNVVGQTWTWKITDNGTLVKSGMAVTRAPSGSFSVDKMIANRTGTDAIAFHAKNKKSGETCVGSVSV